jgi:solute:Na+ symporter, SSS family
MGSVTYWDLLIIAFYLLAVLGYGLWKARNVSTSDDFLVAGRTLGLFVLVGTLVMTEFNTATMIGYASYGYMGGRLGTLLALALVIALGSYTLLVAKRWKRLNAVSVAEMFMERYNYKFKILAVILIVFTLSLLSTTYLKAAAMVFSTTMNLSLLWTVILISCVVLIFTLAGGLVSVSFTNLLSFIIALVALPCLFIISCIKANELGGLNAAFENKYLSYNILKTWDDPILSFKFLFTVYLFGFFVYLNSPWYGQIMFATKNEKVAYKGVFIATLLTFGVYWVAIYVAAYARVGFPDLKDPQYALPMVILNWMPVGIKGLTLALIFSIAQTTMATIWNNNVSIIAQDIYKGIFRPEASDKNILRFSRILTLFIALFTIIISLLFVDIVLKVMFVANIFMVSLFFPGVFGFFWWKTGEKAIWITTILGIISGWTIFLLKEFANENLPIYLQQQDWLFLYCCIITPTIIIIGIITSLLEKENKESIASRVDFYNKVGPPWVGKKEYLKYKKILDK